MRHLIVVASFFGIIGTLMIGGCATHAHCVRTETSYVYVNTCQSYSSNGTCTYSRPEQRSVQSCAEAACDEGYSKVGGKCAATGHSSPPKRAIWKENGTGTAKPVPAFQRAGPSMHKLRTDNGLSASDLKPDPSCPTAPTSIYTQRRNLGQFPAV